MKILHVVGSLNRGGVEGWLTQVMHQIDRRKFQMDFLVHTALPGVYDQELSRLGARVLICLPQLEDRHPLVYARNFRRLLRQHGPYDCVHSHIHHSSGLILLLAAGMGIPVRIVHSHNDTRLFDAKSSPARRLYQAAMKLLIRRFATKGIAVSNAAAGCLFPAPRIADTRWELCSLGVDLTPFRLEVEKKLVRAELGLPPAAFVIGHVGRFTAQKNHTFLLEVAQRVCLQQPAAVFLLVGEGPEKSAFEMRVVQSGLGRNFVFAGSRADIPRLMKGAMDCFVFPSLHEGLGLVLWEAQAAGLPCVVAESLPEEATLLPDQVQRLSLRLSPEIWAAALLRCQMYPAAESRRPLPAAVAAVSIEASVLRLGQLYDQCMQRRTERFSVHSHHRALTLGPHSAKDVR